MQRAGWPRSPPAAPLLRWRRACVRRLTCRVCDTNARFLEPFPRRAAAYCTCQYLSTTPRPDAPCPVHPWCRWGAAVGAARFERSTRIRITACLLNPCIDPHSNQNLHLMPQHCKLATCELQDWAHNQQVWCSRGDACHPQLCLASATGESHRC